VINNKLNVLKIGNKERLKIRFTTIIRDNAFVN
ncbi:MAG: hypothetical protein RIR67_50, partial [Bacteroidota bacterium]